MINDSPFEGSWPIDDHRAALKKTLVFRRRGGFRLPDLTPWRERL
jgi:hypothetical protein